MDTIESRLNKLGLRLPKGLSRPRIEMGKVMGDTLYLSGHGPHDENGQLPWVGRVGQEVNVEEAYLAARQVALNCLGTLKQILTDLERVSQIIKVTGYVNSAPDFYRQPEVMNGFSDLLIELYGVKGKHARSAIGTSVLPHNQPVEVEMIVQID